MARVCLGVVVGMGALLAASLGTGAERPARIIDRTLACPMTGAGYPDPARFMSVGADPFLPASDASPNIYVYNGPGDATGVSAGIRTGAGGQGNRATTGALALTPTLCAVTKLRVSLASSGRNARPTGAFGELYSCEVPARVLIRVRAVFKRPAAFIRNPRYPWLSEAKGNIATASLAVTTPRGKPLFFASVNDATGKARIFVTRSGCSRTR
jgi:hypothetical protein